MAKRLGKIARAVSPFAVLFGVAIWVAGSMQYVPTPEQVQAREDFRPFLVEASSVEGVYANRDVDSGVFRYTTAADDATFWRRIEEQRPLQVVGDTALSVCPGRRHAALRSADSASPLNDYGFHIGRPPST